MHKKLHLDSKNCPACGRDFFWRKKWERDWINVIYCSSKCKKTKSLSTEKSIR
ncbi:DUF2256 domain-containing protein [Gammaproteobacteria bacterium]|nr:DUF2256 domain-containing protein [Gammaproteobacteria bacterium]MDA7829424.1 DUF2256 domain-containing protein [Gammaproteobacteria bacterium]MDA7844127.1 DUF2256 domain-containing protein [Gammaproteobacteria bacterium]MDA9102220.1 DUF2256 domain-containing protein [Gammaproteobacteria bacterium]